MIRTFEELEKTVERMLAEAAGEPVSTATGGPTGSGKAAGSDAAVTRTAAVSRKEAAELIRRAIARLNSL